MSSQQLIDLLTDLDARQRDLSWLDAYYEGRSGPSFLNEDDRKALEKFDYISVNVCAAAVLALQERLHVSGFTGPDGAYELWTDNQLDQLHSAVAHRDALTYGGDGAYVACWVDDRGNPVAVIESAKRMYAQRNPVTNAIDVAVKRVRFKDRSEAWVYTRTHVEHWRSNSGANSSYQFVETLEHHLQAVPVVAIGLPSDSSVIRGITSAQDLLNKTYLDAAVASEYSGRPRRWSVGIGPKRQQKLDDDGDPVVVDGQPVYEMVPPFDEANRFLITENPNAEFGQLDSADMSGFTEMIRAVMAGVELQTGLPPSYCGQLSTAAQPSSGEAMRISEAGLVSRAEARQASFGPSWETVVRILLAIRDGVALEDVPRVRVKWKPAETRTRSQMADAMQKLKAERIIPTVVAQRELGYDDDEILEMRAAFRAEALDSQGVDVGAVAEQ